MLLPRILRSDLYTPLHFIKPYVTVLTVTLGIAPGFFEKGHKGLLSQFPSSMHLYLLI